MVKISAGNLLEIRSKKPLLKLTNLSKLIVFYVCLLLSQTSECTNEAFIAKPLELYNNISEITFIIKFATHDILTLPQKAVNVSYSVTSLDNNFTDLEIEFLSSNTDVEDKLPTASFHLRNETEISQLSIKPTENGYTTITVNVIPPNMTDIREAFLRLSVHYSEFLDYLSDVVGWIYFIAWSISFYPQTFLNWKRKSVIGLHFDFLALNTIGFLLYSIFNIGLYFIPEIKDEYFKRHPYGVNPVQLNDVIFSIHAFFACIIQVSQCSIYERGDQKISQTGKTLIGFISICSIVSLILGSTSVIFWIDFLYFLSYIKLFITLIKYIPQAYYNYLRKSTSGWSIGNILLDFTGGTLSICQMFILAFNYNDWTSIFGDPTKFGLGLVSILFDIYFMIQHYVLYKGHENYSPFPDSPPISQTLASSANHLNYGSCSND